MSPSRFAHVFKEATGVSPHRFRKQLRLERAKYLLDERNWSVTSVAAEVGYSNVSHFISEFKRIFGHTPGSTGAEP
jgi:AraC family transcriptional regulator